MSASDAYAKLAGDLNWFVMCPEIRVIHVATSASERSTALALVATTEAHGDNHSPFIVLEDAHTAEDDGWIARTDRVGVIHETRRQAMLKEGYQLSPLPPVQHEGHPLAAFGWRLVQVLEAQRGVPELQGLVVVLAPTVVGRAGAFAESVRSFLRVPELTSVRFIVLELGDAAVEHLLHGLGDTGMRAACVVDPADHRREQLALLAAMASAPAGASREVCAGGAGPRDRVAPPRARNLEPKPPLPPELAEKIAKELGPAAALLGGSGARLQRRVAGAALAMQEGRHIDALRLQSKACEQCWLAGLMSMGCLLEVALAAFYLAAGHVVPATRAFEVSAKRAESLGLHDVAAHALSGLGAVLMLQNHLQGSAETYVRAGEAAERARLPQLAIEAYRTSGQTSLRAGAEAAAIAIWQRALGVANYAGPEVAATSSAPSVARALACVRPLTLNHAGAQSLYEQADQYERADIAKTNDVPRHDAPSANIAGGAHAG